MSKVTLEVSFAPIDTLYFRGSRPHSAAGASALPSDFPAPVATIVGTVRTRLGDALGVDWREWQTNLSEKPAAHAAIAELIGSAEDTGLLEFSAPTLVREGVRLFRTPAVLLRSENALVRLQPGEPVRCDLGHVRLPSLPAGVVAARPLENTWLTMQGMKTFMAGQLPDRNDVVSLGDLVEYESRLGIGRNVRLATIESGLLYQTEHLRLAPGVVFSVQVRLPEQAASELMDSIKVNPLQRFGGEGRMVELSARIADSPVDLPVPAHIGLLVLLTDMLPSENPTPALLPGFVRVNHHGIDCWQGELNGIAVRIVAVVAGKALARGGWDMQRNAPKPVQTFIPAGSCFFVEPVESGASLAPLHGLSVGRNTFAGAGTLACATA